MRILILILVLSVGFLSACASVNVSTVKVAPPKSDGCAMDIYNSKSEVKRPYESICILTAETGTSLFDDKSVQGAINLARPKACACGGDAMFVEQASAQGASLISWGKGTALVNVIRYIPEAAKSEKKSVKKSTKK